MPRNRNCDYCGAQLATYAAQRQARSGAIICTGCTVLLNQAAPFGRAVHAAVCKALLQAYLAGAGGQEVRDQGLAILAQQTAETVPHD